MSETCALSASGLWGFYILLLLMFGIGEFRVYINQKLIKTQRAYINELERAVKLLEGKEEAP